ncbi:twin-arginine translocation signal domain-containing protein [Kribbella sp. NPDC050470]|uniref:amidohydrolase family protein n=1 Tax=unclassified Kribbella TaxID=2644121 RepID=UPI0037AF3843
MNSSRRQFLARTAAGAAVIAGGTTFTTSQAVAGPKHVTALTNVTVIDVATGRRDRNQTVLIGGDRIIGVGRHLPVPRGAVELDFTGKFVIPGLADMHVHSIGDERVSPPLYLANGVTTVREMAGTNPALYDWRDRIESGTLLGPRMVVASNIIDGDPTLWDPNLIQVIVVDDEPSARAAVRRVKAEGADFVKVYSRLSPASYAAILDEARKTGLTVHGHGPDQLTSKQVSNAG